MQCFDCWWPSEHTPRRLHDDADTEILYGSTSPLREQKFDQYESPSPSSLSNSMVNVNANKAQRHPGHNPKDFVKKSNHKWNSTPGVESENSPLLNDHRAGQVAERRASKATSLSPERPAARKVSSADRMKKKLEHTADCLQEAQSQSDQLMDSMRKLQNLKAENNNASAENWTEIYDAQTKLDSCQVELEEAQKQFEMVVSKKKEVQKSPRKGVMCCRSPPSVKDEGNEDQEEVEARRRLSAAMKSHSQAVKDLTKAMGKLQQTQDHQKHDMEKILDQPDLLSPAQSHSATEGLENSNLLTLCGMVGVWERDEVRSEVSPALQAQLQACLKEHRLAELPLKGHSTVRYDANLKTTRLIRKSPASLGSTQGSSSGVSPQEPTLRGLVDSYLLPEDLNVEGQWGKEVKLPRLDNQLGFRTSQVSVAYDMVQIYHKNSEPYPSTLLISLTLSKRDQILQETCELRVKENSEPFIWTTFWNRSKAHPVPNPFVQYSSTPSIKSIKE